MHLIGSVFHTWKLQVRERKRDSADCSMNALCSLRTSYIGSDHWIDVEHYRIVISVASCSVSHSEGEDAALSNYASLQVLDGFWRSPLFHLWSSIEQITHAYLLHIDRWLASCIYGIVLWFIDSGRNVKHRNLDRLHSSGLSCSYLTLWSAWWDQSRPGPISSLSDLHYCRFMFHLDLLIWTKGFHPSDVFRHIHFASLPADLLSLYETVSTAAEFLGWPRTCFSHASGAVVAGLQCLLQCISDVKVELHHLGSLYDLDASGLLGLLLLRHSSGRENSFSCLYLTKRIRTRTYIHRHLYLYVYHSLLVFRRQRKLTIKFE